MSSTNDPYDVLGVRRDATDEEIKASYRKKAQKSHPDKGGDTDEFQAVNQAYALLSDRTRRERYDRTGNDGQQRDERVMMLQELAGLLFHVVDQCRDVTRIDIVGEMTRMIENGLQQHQQAKAQNEALIKKREVVIKRLTRKGKKKENMLVGMIEADIREKQQKGHQIEEGIEKGKQLLAMLSEYKYKIDEIMQTSSFASTGTGGFSTFIVR